MYTPIVGTLGYILSQDKSKTLLIHRNAREDDIHLNKYNGLGGKMHSDEDVISCLKREIREEAGIECIDIALRGTINWTDFGPHGEDWLGFIFRIHSFSGTPYKENSEGKLSWVPLTTLHDLPMWEGDKFFLPLVFDDDPRIFHGHMPYKNGRPVSWKYVRL